MLKICLILSLILFISDQSLAQNKCLFRGKCGLKQQPFGEFPIPCIIDDGPQPFKNKSTIDILKQFDPDIANVPNPVFCCEDQQVLDIQNQISMAKTMMNRCPSCFVNFAKLFFHMTCSPKQSEFLKVKVKTKSELYPDKYMLVELDYHMTEYYANTTYNACNNVKFPQGGQTIMTLFCGGAAQCSPLKFITFVGGGDQAPFKINFKLSKENQHIKDKWKPMNVTSFPCTKAPIGFSNLTCSCVDCPAQCPTPKTYNMATKA